MLVLKDHLFRPLQFEGNFFPDGQQQFKMLESEARKVRYVLASIPDAKSMDFFLQAFVTLKQYHPEVRINYFYGARSDKDRADEYLVSNTAEYFQQLIMGLCDVTTRVSGNLVVNHYEPHVAVLAPHCVLADGPFLSDFEIGWSEFNAAKIKKNYDMIIFPDESAEKRFATFVGRAEKNGAKMIPTIVCEKHRDQVTGKIISHKIPQLPDSVKRVLACDDLCDGGFTYRSLAERLPADIVADLFIYHGVFSNNALPKMLLQYQNVIVTNSLPAAEEQKALLSEEDQKRVTILNVW